MPFVITGTHWEDRGYVETFTEPSWNAGARTIASLDYYENGAYTFSVGQATGIVCGLNDNDNNFDYTEIKHGFYIENGLFKIIESGTLIGVFSSYTTTSSVFKIERIDGVVRYYKDDVLKYTSLIESVGVVFLDCSLFSANDTIIDATIITDADDGKYGPKLDIELPGVEIGFFADSAFSYVDITVSQPVITIETPDLSSLTITLPNLIVSTADSEISYCDIVLPSLSCSAFDNRIIPDYAILQFSVATPLVLLNEEEHLTLDIEIPFMVSISLVPDYLYIDLPQPVISMDYYYNDVLWLQWPRWTMQFDIYINETLFTIPAPELSITGTNHASAVSFTIPAPTLTAYSGASARFTIPAPTLSISGTAQNLGRVAFEIPEPVLTLTGLTGALATVDVVIPALELAAYGGGTIALTLPALDLAAAGTVNSVAHVTFELPVLELAISGSVSSVARIAFEIPAPELYAGLGNRVEFTIPAPVIAIVAAAANTTAETTYAINLTTGAVTQLLLGGFDKLVTAHGRLYGLKDGALTRLEGDVDGTTTTIPATIRFAQQTFGTNAVKRCSDVYWSTREMDGLTMELVADERTIWRYQTLTDTAPAYGTHKIKTGRGVSFHTAGLTVRNRDGGQLDIGGVELLVSPLSRKPK